MFINKRERYTHNYGSFPGTMGADKDPLDVFVGPNKNSRRAYVVDKMDWHDPSKFDEHKVYLNFGTKRDVLRSAKHHHITIGKIRQISLGDLKQQVRSGSLKLAARGFPVGSVPWHFHSRQHGELKSCTGPRTFRGEKQEPYEVTKQDGKLLINKEKAVGHGIKRKPTLFKFTKRVGDKWDLASGVKQAASQPEVEQ